MRLARSAGHVVWRATGDTAGCEWKVERGRAGHAIRRGPCLEATWTAPASETPYRGAINGYPQLSLTDLRSGRSRHLAVRSLIAVAKTWKLCSLAPSALDACQALV